MSASAIGVLKDLSAGNELVYLGSSLGLLTLRSQNHH